MKTWIDTALAAQGLTVGKVWNEGAKRATRPYHCHYLTAGCCERKRIIEACSSLDAEDQIVTLAGDDVTIFSIIAL